jgi:TctA family transporter
MSFSILCWTLNYQREYLAFRLSTSQERGNPWIFFKPRLWLYDCAPLMLAFVLGPIFEINLPQSLLFSKGSFLIFFNRPITAVFISIAILLLITSSLPYFKKVKKTYEVSTRDD